MTTEKMKEIANRYDIKIAITKQEEDEFLKQGYELVNIDISNMLPCPDLEYLQISYANIQIEMPTKTTFPVLAA